MRTTTRTLTSLAGASALAVALAGVGFAHPVHDGSGKEAGFDTVGDLLAGQRQKAAIAEVMRLVREANKYVSDTEPFKLKGDDQRERLATVRNITVGRTVSLDPLAWRRLGGDTPAQGGCCDQDHPGDRAHRPRHVGGQGEVSRRGLRRL